MDDLVLSLASVNTSLEGSRFKILVSEEFISLLLLRRVMDRLHEEDLLRDLRRRVVVIAAGIAARGIIGWEGGDSKEDALDGISLLLELQAWDDVTSEAYVTCLLLILLAWSLLAVMLPLLVSRDK